jgi:hypothetical protein
MKSFQKYSFFFRYYQGIAKFLAEIKELKGPLQKPPVSINKWPKIEEV